MPRYIDADKVVFEEIPTPENHEILFVNQCLFFGRRNGKQMALIKDALKQIIDNAPTEDVVPRSEVEAMKKKFEREIEDLESTQEITPEAQYFVDTKADKMISLLTEINKTQEQVEQEVAREIFEKIDRLMLDGAIGGKYPAKVINPEKYAELKKEYKGE